MNRPESLLIERSDCALLVIDVQDRLAPHIHGVGRVVENIARLIRFAQIVGIPVLWAEQEKLGQTVEPIREALRGAEPISKVTFGALGCLAFSERLAGVRRGTLLLTGVEAHICVTQTALQALASCAVHVVADAVGSRAPEDCEIALARLRQAGAVVTTTEMVMYEVLREAGTEEFRQVLPLVK